LLKRSSLKAFSTIASASSLFMGQNKPGQGTQLPVHKQLIPLTYPPRRRQGGGRYNQGGIIERSEYPRRFSVWGIAANKQIER
jgi:hypothetical protein